MRDQLNEKFISALKSHISKEHSLVNTIMDILLIGKEATYRRLRGEVYFSFEETAKLSKELNISLDNIIRSEPNQAIFTLDLFFTDNLLDNYYKGIEDYIPILNKMTEDSSSQVQMIFNTLPYVFYLPYGNLSRFRIFRWLHQMSEEQAPKYFSEFKVPNNIIEVQNNFAKEYYKMKRSNVILDPNSFSSTVKDLLYFYKLNIITYQELSLLSQELLQMLDDWESIAEKGRNKWEQKVEIYLSSLDFESCYIHFESKHLQFCFLRSYSINNFISQNPSVCESHKRWIETSKRYSTLISKSGEIQRIEFFNEQRRLVKEML